MSGAKSKEAESTSTSESVPTDRIGIRNKIFSAQPESTEVEFFGVKIELRQPDLGTILDHRQRNIQDATLSMLMNYAFVPGTNERVFEEADEEPLRALPFGPDIQRLTEAVNKLLGTDAQTLDTMVTDATKSPGEGTSQDNGDESLRGVGEDGGGDKSLAA